MTQPITWADRPSADFRITGDGIRYDAVTIDYSWQGKENMLSLPVACKRTGPGPVALIVGGTHGDEYEGQIGALELVHELADLQISGTLVVIPLHNVQACREGARNSPVDGLDINRVYGQATREGPTCAIARFIETQILPEIDVLLDIHSGGVAMEFVLCSNLQGTRGEKNTEAQIPRLLDFGAPYAVVFSEAGVVDEAEGIVAMAHGGTLEDAARLLGKEAMSTEVGGAGRASLDSIRVTRAGIRNFLANAGLLAGNESGLTARDRLLYLSEPEQYVMSPVAGLFAPEVELEQWVKEGEPLCRVYHMAGTRSACEVIKAPVAGQVVAMASRGLIAKGEGIIFLAAAY